MNASEASITSRDVSRALRKEVWPALEGAGFVHRTARTAWRYYPDRIEVVNFQSFNSYLAATIGMTTFSFAVNLGIYVPGSMQDRHVPANDGRARPQEYHCELRRLLRKTVAQPELDRDDIWFVRGPEPGDRAATVRSCERDSVLSRPPSCVRASRSAITADHTAPSTTSRPSLAPT